MNKSLKTLAAAMLLGSTAMAPFAVAQDATPGATTTPPATMDGTTTTPAPVTPDASMDGTSGSMGTTAQAPADAAGSATYLTEQAENQISVNDFMGQAIYTADNQSIGNINDLLVQDDGGIVAAVVGVGGFLGIGEKSVAIPFDKITITRETATGDAADAAADGETQAEVVAEAEVRLTTTETADSLRNAPEFRTLDDQAADAGTTGTMAPTDGTTTSSTDN
ncbi:PRC-barrel domain-containing protein [Rhizobium sp. RU33A]|uniref:PRC-barrel domain-containing protein n=1 Tax=Rhizobium sp. RU33A TaxID=1907413 RepID=UPI0009563D91|nr:PRC-barrel domain-containing protein [Rhizobium sp. RU33A]SIQ04301.1 PRC-barrel domain-containing protein [Rhizobium sp. RU33A]